MNLLIFILGLTRSMGNQSSVTVCNLYVHAGSSHLAFKKSIGFRMEVKNRDLTVLLLYSCCYCSANSVCLNHFNL